MSLNEVPPRGNDAEQPDSGSSSSPASEPVSGGGRPAIQVVYGTKLARAAEPAPGATLPSGNKEEEEIVEMDDLPVRSTAPAHLIADRDFGGGEKERGPRRERDRDGDRPRGRGRDRDRDRGESRPRRDRSETDSNDLAPAGDAAETRGSRAPAASVESEDESSSRTSLRIEHVPETEANPMDRIQEFRPARERRPRSAPATASSGEAPAAKGGLMGWVKSIFKSGSSETAPVSKPSAGAEESKPGRRPRREKSPSGERSEGNRPRRRRRPNGGKGRRQDNRSDG